MNDLLKEAIADAKAVRETALQNAKAALEEAFTPQIKSMLSAKLSETEEEDAEEGMHDEDMDDDEGDAEEMAHAEGYHEDDEEGEAEEGAHEGHGEEEPEEGHHEGEEGDDDEEMDETNLDLEAVIAELEAELAEGEHDDDDEEEVEESTETTDEPVAEEAVSEDAELEEEYEIDEAELKEEEDEDEKEVDESKLSEVQAELDEHKEAVQYLKDKLHEVNILNAKLLYTNKLFKEFSLDNNQKLKVVETFDRAQTTREIKLVYTTMAEQLNENGGVIKRKSIKESASTAVSSTKPSKESSKVISEEADVANRFRKLAGILKG